MRKRRVQVAAALGALLVATTAVALAQISPLDVRWYTVDGGSSLSTGSAYQLSGTIGQPDAGVQSGGTYRLSGGFWNTSLQAPGAVTFYLPAVFH